MATGGKQFEGLACGDSQDNSPAANPEPKAWLAAIVASTALPGTPGAIVVPPTVPSRPP